MKQSSSHVREYASKLPKVTRQAVNGLASENESTFAILMLLLENDGELSPIKIQETLGLSDSEFDQAITSLTKGGLIEKRVGDEIGRKATGKYHITEYGENILTAVYEAFPTEET